MYKKWSIFSIILLIFSGIINNLHSEIPTSVNNLHVDCTSNGLGKRPVKEIFKGMNICLQSISHCQQVFSAAAIGAVEARYSDDDQVFYSKRFVLFNNNITIFYLRRNIILE